MDPEISKLLTLQEHDADKLNTELELQRIPTKIGNLEQKIADEQKALEAKKNQLKSFEVKRNEMRTERRAAEDQIAKYKTQQLQVKKNEEYAALTHEIETLTQKVSEAEEHEIALLMEIDTEAEGLKGVEAEVQKRIQLHEGEIGALKTREQELQKQISGLKELVEKAANEVHPKYLKGYENVKKRFKKPPFAIPIIDKKVQGLRVSNEIESAARKGEGLVIDEITGRIVYWP